MAVGTFAFSNAQTGTSSSMTNSSGVRFGLKAGINVSTLSGDVQNAHPRIGFQGGGLVEFRISPKFAIQPEVLVSLQGARDDYDENFNGFDKHYSSKINLGYINVPIMFKFYPIENLSIEAGPQIGVLIAAKQDDDVRTTGNGLTTNESRVTDIKDVINTVDFGANIGASYYFTDNFFASLRYTIGLTSIAEGSYRGNGTVGNPNYVIRNNVFAASIGYRF